MSVLISLINVVERIASSAEQFLLFGEDVDSDIVTVFFFEKLVCNLEIVENCVFDVMVKGRKRKVEFKLPELPNNIKMPSYLAGELSNATTYILTFANVRYKDCPYSKGYQVLKRQCRKKNL